MNDQGGDIPQFTGIVETPRVNGDGCTKPDRERAGRGRASRPRRRRCARADRAAWNMEGNKPGF